MNGCDGYSVAVLLYLDNELKGQELEDFQNHLSGCDDCQQKLAEEDALSRLLRRSRPLYTASDSLRARVSAASAIATANLQPPKAPERLHQRIYRLLVGPFRAAMQPSLHWKALTAAVLVIAFGFAFVPAIVQQARATAYVDTAVEAHRRYLDGALPLEIQSDSPSEVTKWFAGKVPFRFELPAPQATDQKAVYQLSGARLVNYRGSYAALVTYHMREQKISVLVASSDTAVAAGGDKARTGNILFHYFKRDSYDVATWSSHGLTYALVSSPGGSVQQSCLVCHQNMADHGHFIQQAH
jgi:anti-sigma factor RsiW